MKKLLVLLLAVVMVFTFAACGGSNSGDDGGDSAEPTKLVFAHIFAADTMEDKAAHIFADKLKELTNGAYEVDVYPAGQMGQMAEILEQQQTGTAHFQIISTTAMASIDSVAAVDSWPYVYDSREQFEKAYASDAGKKWVADVEAATGFKLVAPMYKGFRQIFVNYDVNTLDDLKGCKLRVPGFDTVIATFEAWGMAPTPMSTAEVYTAMQQNVVEGMEIELSTAYSMGMADVSKTIIMSNHMACNYAILVFNDFYNSLPAEVQEAVEQAGSEAAKYLSDAVEEEDNKALEAFKAAGIKIIEPDMTPWIEAAKTTLAEKYPEYEAYAEAMREAAQ